jgi:hypothetical protein
MQNRVDPELYPETTKFLSWYEGEKAKGLVDLKFFPANTSDSTAETFFEEVNRAINAEDIADPSIS